MWHGVLLFLLGLLTGLVEQRFTNVRMGLAAHLEGMMNGIFLIALGAIWNEVSLSPLAKGTTYWVVLYGTYANWLFTTLAAVFGTAASNPTIAAGYKDNLGRKVLLGRDS
jgi:hydroxylaminobenzene mutase